MIEHREVGFGRDRIVKTGGLGPSIGGIVKKKARGHPLFKLSKCGFRRLVCLGCWMRCVPTRSAVVAARNALSSQFETADRGLKYLGNMQFRCSAAQHQDVDHHSRPPSRRPIGSTRHWEADSCLAVRTPKISRLKAMPRIHFCPRLAASAFRAPGRPMPPPQATRPVGEAPDRLQPALPLDPQLLQERRLLGRDLADFPFRDLPSGPFQQSQRLGKGRVQAAEVRGPGGGHRLPQRLLGDLQRSQPRPPSLKRRVPDGFRHLA